MTLVKFQCPTCGGHLDDPGQGSTVRCPYCSASFVVPQELIAARSVMLVATAPVETGAPSGEPSGKPVSGQGKFFQDDFFDPKSGWDVGQRSGGVTLAYDSGSYRIFLPQDETAWESYVDDNYTDFEVEVEVVRIKGPKDGEFGVTCRVNEDGCYSFWVTGEGNYGICKVYYGETDDDEEEYVDLAQGRAGFLQLSNGYNRLNAGCVGHKLTMLLNGRKALEVEDNEFARGDIGLMASTGESDKGGLDVRFKNLVVRAP